MPNKNLLELCLSPSLGGLELYMMHTAKALNDEFNVTSVVASDAQLEPYFKDSQYRCISIKHKGNSSFISARKVAKIIDENDIDIIHIHWTSDLPTMVMAKMMSKKRPKLVQTRHMNMTRFKNDFYHRFLYKKMDMILTVTSQLADQIKKFIPESVRPEVEVLYIGSDKAQPLNEEDIKAYRKEIGVKDEFVIGMVGRIEEAKGQYLLIEAVEKLKDKGTSVKAFFVGHVMQESYFKTVEQMVKDKGLEKEIIFLGFTTNPLRFMQGCDVMVSATKCETFGLVIIEAMQVGTPAIAANQCGPLEIIEDMKSGLLFEADNSNELYKKLNYMYENDEMRVEMAKEGKKRADELFSNEKQFKKLSKIFREL